MIQNILVVGSGTAGLIVAASLKRRLPHLAVRIVRSPEIGTIGVGESTTPNLGTHLFDYLGMSRKFFYAKARPTWKLGIRFLWGPRGRFDYGFNPALDSQVRALPRSNGYYCGDEFSCVDVPTALMRADKVFPRQANGCPDIQPWHAFNLENADLVATLEEFVLSNGVEIVDGKVIGTERGPQGIAAVMLEDGRRLDADFFIDSSGFASILLGRALEEPFIGYGASLPCDRAVVGGWERGDEPILPYTTAETMAAGWSWQIEHERHINRGYVFSSSALSDDEANAEFLARNPKLTNTRVVKFHSGRYRRSWVDNVVAVGNSSGFVEPLESTALMIVCQEAQTIADFLKNTACAPTLGIREMYNKYMAETWDEIRDFLALHYRFNSKLDTPFWRMCQAEVDLAGAAPLLEFYRENGPLGFARHLLKGHAANFGIDGFLTMLVGNKVSYDSPHQPTASELNIWEMHREANKSVAANGMTVKEALAYVHHPNWQWQGDGQPSSAG